jgi:RNA polymerase sigma factor (sigma-70 family)
MRLFSTQTNRSAPELTEETLHRCYLAPVYRFVFRRVPHRGDAEDITAETFAAAFAAMNRLRRSQDPELYLLGIARRKCIDHARRQKRQPEPEPLDEAQPTQEHGPLAHALQAERRQELWRYLAALPQDQRDALLLQHLEDLSVAQVAQVLGKSLGATNSLLQRARARVLALGGAYFLEETHE